MPDTSANAESLKDINLFSGLSDEALAHLSKIARTVRVKSGQALFVQGDEADGCYAVLSGALRVSYLSAEGNEIVISMTGPGDVVGEMGLFGGNIRSATVTAQSDCEMAFMNTGEFLRFADANPDIYRYLLKLLMTRLRATNEAFAAASTMPLSGRLARVLVLLSNNFGHPLSENRILIRHRFTQADLCLMAGSARENISRQLNAWRKKALIDRISYYYCLNDVLEMRRIAGW